MYIGALKTVTNTTTGMLPLNLYNTIKVTKIPLITSLITSYFLPNSLAIPYFLAIYPSVESSICLST